MRAGTFAAVRISCWLEKRMVGWSQLTCLDESEEKGIGYEPLDCKSIWGWDVGQQE